MNIGQILKDILVFMENGDVETAEKKLKEVLNKYPTNPDGLSLLGIIFIHQKRFKKGQDLILKSLAIIPNQPQALLHMGISFYQENFYDRAIDFFDKAISFNSKFYEAWYCKALSLQKKGLLDKAISCFSQAILINPLYLDSIINLGYLYFDSRNYALAISTFEKGLVINPQNIEILNMIGNAHNELACFEQAIKFFNQSLQIKSDQDDALIGVAHAQMNIGSLEEALKIYNFVINKNPNNVLALNNRANIFYIKGDYDLGIGDINIALKIEPNFVNLHNTYGNILVKLKKFDQALEEYNIAIKINENYAEAFQNRGALFYELLKYSEALIDFSMALKLNNKYLDAYNSRGVLYLEMNNYPYALRDFRRGLRIKPNDIDLLSNLALFYNKIKLFDKSEVFHSRAVKNRSNLATIDNIKLRKANYNYALHLLTLKKFSKEAWIYYEDRKYMEIFSNTILPYTLELAKKKKVWEGQGDVLVIGEQGIGDQIFYARFLNDHCLGKNHVQALVTSKILDLMKRSFCEVNFFPATDPYQVKNLDQIKFDSFIAQADLGKFSSNNIEDIKNQSKPFLKSDPLKTQTLKNLLTKPNKKICGLSWFSRNISLGKFKNIELKDLKNIINLRNLSFVNLQYGDVFNEVKEVVESNNIEINLVEEVDKFDDIDGLTSLIDACDFVVTISNVTAHIAGGLGKETYLLIPYSAGKIWYWHENDEVSIWYPSIKIFRQDKEGLWTNAINNIAENLKERLINE